ncbi:MAG: single-stranded-DNA-specific exonuclease RecJ [Alphaproteobacteria bacterium]|nr:single-stranded-DNA-specific exonuclease RecJ [Alphaproteobacteria bacterium]
MGDEQVERLALGLSQRFGLPDLCARVLASRGVDLDTAALWLNPSLKEHLPDPSHLKDMDRAVDRLVRAIRDGETIAVFGDYDVDGATSSALFLRYFRTLGVTTLLHIPDRVEEGYGPNAPALRSLKQRGASLCVTVDCGATAHEPLGEAAAAGLDVIVCDHHVGEPALPPAVAVVNPNRFDEESEHTTLAAVGVSFLMLVALNRALRAAGYFTEARPQPNLLGYLDLVALGTVADVVSLTGLNRTLVSQGLKILAQRGNPGLAALADIAGVSEKPGAYHLGFVLGPRINAGGRIGHAFDGTRLLTTDDPDEARGLAIALDKMNTDRKALEAEVLAQAIDQAEAAGHGTGHGPVLVAGEGWHPGVIGIVASRLKERYNRPALVVALDDGVGKGSGRSLSGIDLGSLIIAARQEGLLIAGGGHKMAAGFTVAQDALTAFQAFLDRRIAAVIGAEDWAPVQAVDAQVTVKGASAHFISALEGLGPYGAGNPEPRFVLPALVLDKVEAMGKDHLRCFVSGAEGGKLKGVAWRVLGTPLGDALLASRGRPMHLVGTLRIDPWGGYNRPQLTIQDAAWA